MQGGGGEEAGGEGGVGEEDGGERCLVKYMCSIVLMVNFSDMVSEEMQSLQEELASAIRELWTRRPREWMSPPFYL